MATYTQQKNTVSLSLEAGQCKLRCPLTESFLTQHFGALATLMFCTPEPMTGQEFCSLLAKKNVDVWQANSIFVKSCHVVKVNEYPLIQHYWNVKSITVQGTPGQSLNDNKASVANHCSSTMSGFPIAYCFLLLQYQPNYNILSLGIVLWWWFSMHFAFNSGS